MKKVKDFMCTDVLCFSPDDSIFDVAKALSQRGVSGAPVVKDGRLIGVVSETDIVKFMALKLAESIELPKNIQSSLSMLFLQLFKLAKSRLIFKQEIARISRTAVRHIMTRAAVSVTPDTNIFEAAAVMEKHDINRLPVVENGKLVGIIARADLIRALVE